MKSANRGSRSTVAEVIGKRNLGYFSWQLRVMNHETHEKAKDLSNPFKSFGDHVFGCCCFAERISEKNLATERQQAMEWVE